MELYEDISNAKLGKLIYKIRKNIRFIKLNLLSKYFNVFLKKCNIYHVNWHEGDVIIKIKDDSFFDEYYSYYRHLYKSKDYYVWYKLFWEKSFGNRNNKKKSKEVRDYIKNRDGNKCLMCGSPNDLTIDHINPISKSGDNTIYNLATLCEKHNT